MSDDDAGSDETEGRVAADLGASASLSFDTVGDDPVGVELAVDLGAIRCEVVLDDAAAETVADRLHESRGALTE